MSPFLAHCGKSITTANGEGRKRATKRRDSRYHSGRSRDWIKIKNMAHPATERAMLIALSKRRTTR